MIAVKVIYAENNTKEISFDKADNISYEIRLGADDENALKETKSLLSIENKNISNLILKNLIDSANISNVEKVQIFENDKFIFEVPVKLMTYHINTTTGDTFTLVERIQAEVIL